MVMHSDALTNNLNSSVGTSLSPSPAVAYPIVVHSLVGFECLWLNSIFLKNRPTSTGCFYSQLQIVCLWLFEGIWALLPWSLGFSMCWLCIQIQFLSESKWVLGWCKFLKKKKNIRHLISGNINKNALLKEETPVKRTRDSISRRWRIETPWSAVRTALMAALL